MKHYLLIFNFQYVKRLRPCSRAFFYKFCELNVFLAKACYGGYFSTFPDCILLYLLVYGQYHIRRMMVVGTVHPNIRFWQVLVVRDLCDTTWLNSVLLSLSFSVILSLIGCWSTILCTQKKKNILYYQWVIFTNYTTQYLFCSHFLKS